MSDNAEFVLGILRVFETDDWEQGKPVWHEDALMTGPPDWPESEPFRGRAAVVAQFRRLAAEWERQSFDDPEVVRDDGEWVVLRWTWSVRGAASGVALQIPFAGAYRIEDGMLAEAHFRKTVDEVLELVPGA